MRPTRALLAYSIGVLATWGIFPALVQTARAHAPGLTDGVVRKIDIDKAMLDPLKVGDKVGFMQPARAGR